MPETIKFELSSRTAIIKKPDSNETYYTYNFPHKIMLLGILGAIIGLNGYNYYALKKNLGKDVEKLPEFYSKLENLKIAIVPKINHNNIKRKIQTFNNSVGYASKEEGNNLIVQEQWLENPSWDIYILKDDSKEYNLLKDYLLNKKCVFIPYIGKNDHFANIRNVEILEISTIEENVDVINSLFAENIIKEINDESEDFDIWSAIEEKEFYYKEIMPVKLSDKIGYYDFKPFIFTNKKIIVKEEIQMHYADNKVLYYF